MTEKVKNPPQVQEFVGSDLDGNPVVLRSTRSDIDVTSEPEKPAETAPSSLEGQIRKNSPFSKAKGSLGFFGNPKDLLAKSLPKKP